MKQSRIWFCLLIVVLLISVCLNSDFTNNNDSSIECVDSEEEKTIILATYGTDTLVQNMVAAFNRENDEFDILIKDISDNNSYNAVEALTKLNTEIMAGNEPDMICFQSISPFPYVSKGLLLDLTEILLDIGNGVDDLSVPAAFEGNPVYYISNSFTFQTLIGKHSVFGDRYGWTLQEYLDFEANGKKYDYTIYNVTRELFLEQVFSRYMLSAIDWENAKCDFENEVFAEILNASKRIRETPSEGDNLIGPGAMFVRDEVFLVASSWVTSVDKLAVDERFAGEKLSYIGWPTVDGSCGTDIYLNSPIGVFASSDSYEGCRAFIKFILQDYECEFGMPMYLPNLMEQIIEAKAREGEDEKPISSEYADRFIVLLSKIKNIAIYDKPIIEIAMKEADYFLNGDRDVKKVLEYIQSKASLYIAEQK